MLYYSCAVLENSEQQKPTRKNICVMKRDKRCVRKHSADVRTNTFLTCYYISYNNMGRNCLRVANIMLS